eukprot:674432-Rhodomonas_salina.1
MPQFSTGEATQARTSLPSFEHDDTARLVQICPNFSMRDEFLRGAQTQLLCPSPVRISSPLGTLHLCTPPPQIKVEKVRKPVKVAKVQRASPSRVLSSEAVATMAFFGWRDSALMAGSKRGRGGVGGREREG